MKVALAVLLVASVSWGATVTGRVQDTGGTGVPSMEVRLWGPTPKGYSLLAGATTLTDGNGHFSFTIAEGTYKLDTRMGPGAFGNWGDRWYDADGDGYDPAGADVLTVTAAGLSGLVITVELFGGVDGNAFNAASTPLGGINARAELMSNRAVHHNDTTKGFAGRAGEFSFRGLRPGATRLLLHDPNFTLADTVVPNLNVTSNTVLAAGNVIMPPADTSAHEPDNFDGDTQASIDGARFHASPPQPYEMVATIGPRAAQDTDWYCFDAQAPDRYVVTVLGTVTLEDGAVVTSPWLDPMVSFWRSGSRIAENDDAPGLGLGSRLDTGELGSDGHSCVVVSTYGDSQWNGAGQTSAGRYALRIEMGNRRPLLTVTLPNGTPLTGPVTIDETDNIGFRFTFLDPDGNLTGGTVEIHDAMGAVVGGATMDPATGTFLITWTASQTAARNGPYEFVGSVTDGEFTVSATATVIVNGVNLPPTVPALKSPDAGAVVSTPTPALVCLEATDPDEETLTYEFELTRVRDGGVQLGSAVGVTGGWRADAGTPRPEVVFTTPALPENEWFRWRARAFDGTTSNGRSPWTPSWTFFVDAVNDAPGTPALTKPNDGEEVSMVRPALQSTNPVDPEGDAVSLQFEVARDIAFTQLVETSAPVPTAQGSSTTQYTLGAALDWGGVYFARVKALDARGAETPYSNVNQFQVRNNTRPTAPSLGAPFAACGAGLTLTQAPGHLTVPNVNDVEMDALTVEVQLFRAADDPATATPLFSATVAQQGLLDTTVLLTGVTWANGDYRVRVRVRDPFNTTAWVECVFTLAVPPPVTDAGAGGGGGTGGGSGSDAGTADAGTGGSGGGGTTQTARPGCGCSSGDPLSLAALGWLLARRLRNRRRH